MSKEVAVKLDWDRLGKLALNMYRAGIKKKDIAELLGCEKNGLFKKLEARIKEEDAKRHSVIVSKAYDKAMNGDKDMMKFILKSQCGWDEKKELKVSGEIGIRPILNISLKEPDGKETHNDEILDV